MNWFEVNLKDPNSIAIFAAWGQWAGAGASLLAVVIALAIAIWSGVQSGRQSRRVRYDSARPVLAISSRIDSQSASHPIHTEPGLSSYLDWNVPSHIALIKNVGSGTAFNIVSVLFGPESVVKNNQSLDASRNLHWRHETSHLCANDTDTCTYSRNDNMFLNRKRIAGHPLLAPAQPLMDPTDPMNLIELEPTYVCRIATTYHDIFGCKHASIFDRDINGNWTKVAILEISNDLYELGKLKYSPLLKRLNKRVPRLKLIWPR